MKLNKSEITYLVQIIGIWAFINLIFNMFGLWFTKLLNPEEFSYLDSVGREFVKPLVIQLLIFAICSTATYVFLKKKKLAFYSFVAVQFVVFHVIFLLNFKFNNGMHFASTFANPGIQYLSYCGQYLVDVLYLYFPINGNFDNGMFAPTNIGTFYIHWIILNIVYYLFLTWISIITTKYFFETKVEVNKK